MSLAYLQKQRKSELVEFAQATSLPGYSNMKKGDLETALDDHLKANQSTYSQETSLNDYYKKLEAKSPVKKAIEKVTEMVKSEDDAPVKKPRRKTKTPEDMTEEGAITTLVKTPAKDLVRRSTSFAQNIPLPPSPAVVTNAIDRQTTRMRNSISEAYSKSNVTEYSDYVREMLSSPAAINALALVVEAAGLRATILPAKAAGDIPAVPYVTRGKTTVYLPDVFLLLTGDFWAPFSLWLLASVLLPLALSYFINIPLKTSSASSAKYGTRRVTAVQSSPAMQFDSLIFNVAKAFLAYMIFAQHYTLGLYKHVTVATVNESMAGGYKGMITSASIAGLVSLYEAVLTK